MPQRPRVFVSPDGRREQTAATPEREVALRFDGWRPKPAKTTRPKPTDDKPTSK